MIRRLLLILALAGMLAGCGQVQEDAHRVEDIDAEQDTEEWW